MLCGCLQFCLHIVKIKKIPFSQCWRCWNILLFDSICRYQREQITQNNSKTPKQTFLPGSFGSCSLSVHTEGPTYLFLIYQNISYDLQLNKFNTNCSLVAEVFHRKKRRGKRETSAGTWKNWFCLIWNACVLLRQHAACWKFLSQPSLLCKQVQ